MTSRRTVGRLGIPFAYLTIFMQDLEGRIQEVNGLLIVVCMLLKPDHKHVWALFCRRLRSIGSHVGNIIQVTTT